MSAAVGAARVWAARPGVRGGPAASDGRRAAAAPVGRPRSPTTTTTAASTRVHGYTMSKQAAAAAAAVVRGGRATAAPLRCRAFGRSRDAARVDIDDEDDDDDYGKDFDGADVGDFSAGGMAGEGSGGEVADDEDADGFAQKLSVEPSLVPFSAEVLHLVLCPNCEAEEAERETHLCPPTLRDEGGGEGLRVHQYDMSKQLGTRMRRVRMGTPVHYEQTVREEDAASVLVRVHRYTMSNQSGRRMRRGYTVTLRDRVGRGGGECVQLHDE